MKGRKDVSDLLDTIVAIADDNAGPAKGLRPKGHLHPDDEEWNSFAEVSQWSLTVEQMRTGGNPEGYLDGEEYEPEYKESELEQLELEPEDYMILSFLSEPRSATQVQRHLQAKGILSVKYHEASFKQAERMVKSLVNKTLVSRIGETRYARKRSN